MNPVFITWNKMPEVVGGCESVFQDLSSNLDGKLVSYPFGNKVYQVEGMPEGCKGFKFFEDYKSWMFDDMISKMLVEYPNTPIIGNAGAMNIWKKHDTKIINLFNDPYRKAQKVMREKGSRSIYIQSLVDHLTELQKRSSEGAKNIAISKIMREAMQDEGIECHKVIEHGVDSSAFRPLSKTGLREKYGVFASKIGIFVGINHPIKNWEVMERLIREREDVFWILVFKENPPFETPNSKVFNKIPRSQMPEIYNLADFAIIPSYFESFGLVAVEAGMCDIPVISSKVGWIEDEGKTDYGIILDSFKAKDFSQAVDELFQQDFKPRAYMQKRFDFMNWLEKWRDVIRN